MQTAKIINLSPSDSFTSITKNNSPLIVDFYADWCGPCKRLGPILEEECKKYGIALCKVNVDQNQELSSEYNVRSIPAVFLFVDGKVVDSFTGLNTDSLRKMIDTAKAKVNKFQGKGVSLGGLVEAKTDFTKGNLPNEPEDSPDCYHIMFRYNNMTFERRFNGSDTIGQMKDFVRNKIGAGNISIFTPFPRKVYDKDSSTIIECGLSKKEMLNVALI